MRRREFIAALGGAAAWPLAARAQQPGGMKRVGVFFNQTAGDPVSPDYVTALSKGLQESGWFVGRNLQIDYRWVAGDPNRARRDADELLALAPDVVVANGSPSATALQAATRTCRSYLSELSIRSARALSRA